MDRGQFLQTISLGFLGFVFRKSEPEVKQTLIYEGYVAGLQFHELKGIYHFLSEGSCISLKREPNNPHDKNAIAVWHGNFKLGYIPRKDNQVLSTMLDSSIQLKGLIRKIKKEKFMPPHGIKIEVYQG